MSLVGTAGETFGQRFREACGVVPPEDAVQLGPTAFQIGPRQLLRLPLTVRNTSADDFVIAQVLPREGFSVTLVADGGSTVDLPLPVPAGDFTVPRLPDADNRRTRFTAIMARADCNSEQRPSDGMLLELLVASAEGDPVTRLAYGDDDEALRGLIASTCPQAAIARE